MEFSLEPIRLRGDANSVQYGYASSDVILRVARFSCRLQLVCLLGEIRERRPEIFR